MPNRDVTPKEIVCGDYEWKILPDSGTTSDSEHYHVNAAAFIQIAKWLDYLKDNNCYDNTRIIIVADHGFHIPTPSFNNMKFGLNYANFNPLLMVKDFSANGNLKTDDSLMTNADTIFFATKDFTFGKTNPFTGNRFEDFMEKQNIKLYPAVDINNFNEWNPLYLKDTKLWILQDEKYHTPSYTVHDNIFEESNWERIVK